MASAASTDRGPLTPRQAEILAFIRSCSVDRGYPPTIREIGERFGIGSPNGVVSHLKALATKGYIARGANVSRGIRLVGDARLAAVPPEALSRLAEVAAAEGRPIGDVIDEATAMLWRSRGRS